MKFKFWKKFDNEYFISLSKRWYIRIYEKDAKFIWILDYHKGRSILRKYGYCKNLKIAKKKSLRKMYKLNKKI